MKGGMIDRRQEGKGVGEGVGWEDHYIITMQIVCDAMHVSAR